MKKLEANFLQSIQEKNLDESSSRFEEIFEELTCEPDLDLRDIKNYMISLNGIIYHICRTECNRDSCFKLRFKISELFESCSNCKDLKKCSLEMINYYLDASEDDFLETSNATVNAAIIFMKKNLNKPLTLGDVADNVHISKSYLSSLLAKHAKYSFPELLTEMRIDHAKTLLKDTNCSILDISYKCGFNSQSYFCTTFKKIVGITPTVFREND